MKHRNEIKPKFNPFDKVLIKWDDEKGNNIWKIAFFESYDDKKDVYHVEGLYAEFKHCIPYNEKTKHLLGTTNNLNYE